MKKIFGIILFIAFTSILFGQSDYKKYYETVYGAENYLMDEEYDSAAVEYQKAFKQVDYVFVKDLMNTTYLSIILKNDSMFVSSLTKAFCEGLEINDPMIVKNKKIQKYNKSLGNILEEKYDSCRYIYIHTYNLEIRKKLFIFEERDQRYRSKGLFKKYDRNKYQQMDSINSIELLNIINKYGFPGPQLVGYIDIYATANPIGIVIHHLNKEEMPDSILIEAIYDGKYQPNAYAQMYDYHHTNYTLEIPNNKRLQTKAYYWLNPTSVDNDSLAKKVNNYRKEILMPTIQFSQKKYNYLKKHHDNYFILY